MISAAGALASRDRHQTSLSAPPRPVSAKLLHASRRPSGVHSTTPPPGPGVGQPGKGPRGAVIHPDGAGRRPGEHHGRHALAVGRHARGTVALRPRDERPRLAAAAHLDELRARGGGPVQERAVRGDGEAGVAGPRVLDEDAVEHGDDLAARPKPARVEPHRAHGAVGPHERHHVPAPAAGEGDRVGAGNA
jgi:hypothetical protein